MLRSTLLLQTLFVYLLSPPGICISKTWRCTKFKCLSLNLIQKQVAFYINLYNLVLARLFFWSLCIMNQIHLSHFYL